MVKIFLYGFLGLILGSGIYWMPPGAKGPSPINALQQIPAPDTKAEVDSLMDASWAARNTDISKANKYAKQALRAAKELDYTAGIARSHYLIGITDQRVGSHEKAMQHFLISLQMERARGDKERIGKVLNGLAVLYYRQGDYTASIKYFKRAVDVMREVGNMERAAISTANIGLIYYNRGEYKKALSKYNAALEAFRSGSDNKLAIYATLSNVGNILTKLGKYEQAEKYHLESLSYFRKNGLIRNESEVLLNLSTLYYASDEQSYRAIRYAQASLRQAQSINFKETIVAAYKQLAHIYENDGEFKKALEVYKQFKATQDSLLNSERIAAIKEMETRFNLKEKNRQIQLLNKEADLQKSRLARQKLWRYLLIIGTLLLAIIVALLYRYNNQKKRANALLEKRKRQIEDKNEQLTLLNDEKSEFMGMAAHDLRNPLAGIKSVISMIRFDDNIAEQEIRDYLEIMDHSADRMLILINNLLDVNAIEEGARSFELSAVPVDVVINRAVQSQQRSAEAKDIRIRRTIKNEADVKANPEALQRVLENLLSNAVKYSPAESTVDITARIDNENMEIAIYDEGPGIPRAEQDELFKRFSRISTLPTGNESSMGLGLFVVKNLMEKMGGTVRYDGEAGNGAVFVITLPRVELADEIMNENG